MTAATSDALKTYLTAIEQALKAGNATEHTHRPALKALLEEIGGRDARATNEPRQIECGAPDFIVNRGMVPLGYVEAKDVGIDLRRVEKSEQLGRYRGSLGNLVLTDYIEFRWYLDGELRLTASLPRPDKNGRIRFNADAAGDVAQLLSQFISADIPLKATPHDLATRMAGMGTLIRELIALHVMDTTLPRITTFDVTGSNQVDKVRWVPPSPQPSPASGRGGESGGRVYINASQYFGNVPSAVWDMHVGGYRVAEKWLKDRKGLALSYDDLTHYQSVIAALARTLELQADIDGAIEASGGWPLA